MEVITHDLAGAIVIGIDCAPMTARPDTYIKEFADILNITEIPEVSTKSFGAWTWEFPNMTKEFWDSKKEEVVTLARGLYEAGSIRGAQHHWNSAIETYMRESSAKFGSFMLLSISPEDIAKVLDPDSRVKFTTDYGYAKSLIDDICKEDKKSRKAAVESADT